MELKWLEDFLSLSDTGNFRTSSERRYVSQPAFSRRIKTLENWVGATLIDRSVQPVRLTSAGELFKPVAREIVQKAHQLRDDIKKQSRAKEGKIRFSTLSTLAQFFMPGWFKKLQPFIATQSLIVRTDFGRLEDYFEALEAGIVDFFICYAEPSGMTLNDTAKFSSLQLDSEILIPVVSPDSTGNPEYWLPSAKPGSSIPYLHTYSNPSLWPVKQLLESRYGDLDFIPVYETSIAAAIRAMVIEGYGVAWIPESVVGDDLASGRLVRAANEDDDIAVNINIYRCEKNTESRLEKFWQVLQQRDAGHSGPN